MAATVSVNWIPLSPSEIAELQQTYPMERWGNQNSAMNDIWEFVSSDILSGKVDISDKTKGKENIKKLIFDYVKMYARLQKAQYLDSAEDHAIYAVQRMMKALSSKSHDPRVESALSTSQGTFKAIAGDTWDFAGKEMTLSARDIGENSGFYGTFGEQAFFAAGVGSANDGIAPYTRSLPDLLSADNLTLSASEMKTTLSKGVKAGTVSINIQRPKVEREALEKIHYEGYIKNTDPSVVAKMEDTAKESFKSIEKDFTELLKDAKVLDYVIGRTMGIIKLFEKMISVIIFGVEVKDKGAGWTEFQYNAATMFANLKYEEVLKKLEESYGDKIMDFVTVSSRWKDLTSDDLYANIELSVTLKTGAIKIGKDFKMTSDLYATTFNIFNSAEQRADLFTALYKFQKKGTIATNVEVLRMINDAKKISRWGFNHANKIK